MTDPVAVVISGPAYAGKTFVARSIAEVLGLAIVSSREILSARLGDRDASRSNLQRVGVEVEQATDGAWLEDGVRVATSTTAGWVVDAVRTPGQLDALRRAQSSLLHLHVTASVEERWRRFQATKNEDFEDLTFEKLAAHPLEKVVGYLIARADGIVDSTALSLSETRDAAIAAYEAASHRGQ